MTAIQIVGSQSALARAINARQQDVWYWVHRAKAIPAKYAPPIEAATNGKVTRHQLCPDVFGPGPAQTQDRAA